ncbi:hypothetical protein UFOVP539_7 [uncultured Caudovirales phage]|uniref:Uncharacterized protein n=1 Tax=uncultured Caudovirales phage TaxID=2100421 RepID=A0A6J5MRU5_9CAUD|nr:hypothetical protein UFOVP539_7 [uncultured Caudovirales phage]
MSQSRKHRGFRTERVIAEYLRRWWEGASVGRGSGRDILNVPFDCEVKARTGLDVVGTLRQIESRTKESGLLGFATFRLNGQGERAEEYVSMLRFGDLVELLLAAGYGTRKDEIKDSDINRCICGQWTTNNLCKLCEVN